MIHDDFTTLAVIVGVAAAAGIVANRLRQPFIVAFIAVGILAGPSGFGRVEGGDDLELPSDRVARNAGSGRLEQSIVPNEVCVPKPARGGVPGSPGAVGGWCGGRAGLDLGLCL